MPGGEERRRAVCGRTARTERWGARGNQASRLCRAVQAPLAYPTSLIESTLAWVTLPGGSDSWRALRLSAVRGFAAYLHALDDAHPVPPADLCPNRPARATPYPYSDQQIAALMAATVILRGRLRQATYRTLIGLLAVTGMRVGEAIRLDRDDVDLAHGVLTVRDTKFGKSRELPVHSSTVKALRDYARERDRLCREPTVQAVLVSQAETRLLYCAVHATFKQLRDHAGLRSRSVTCRPRIHDFRHRFAVQTLLDWYRSGVDVQPLIAAAVYVSRAHPAERQLLVFDRRDPAARARR